MLTPTQPIPLTRPTTPVRFAGWTFVLGALALHAAATATLAAGASGARAEPRSGSASEASREREEREERAGEDEEPCPEPALSIDGKVTNDTGLAMAGIRVRAVLAEEEQRYEVFEAVTDEAGAFHFDHVIPSCRPYHVGIVATAPGRAFASAVQDAPAGRPLTPVTLALVPSPPVTLRFVDPAGRPRADLVVLASARHGRDGADHVMPLPGSEDSWQRTAADGSVVLHGFAAGDAATVTLRRASTMDAGRTVRTGGQWHSRSFRVTDAPITLVAGFTGTLEGRVTDETGAPVADAQVFSTTITRLGGDDRLRRLATLSQRDGSFRVAEACPVGEPHSVDLLAFAEGRTFESARLESRDGALPAATAFVLPVARPVRVQVIDGAGAPVPAATLVPERRTDAAGRSRIVPAGSTARLARRAGPDGIATLSFFAGGDRARVIVTTPAGRAETLEIEIPAEGADDVVVPLRLGQEPAAVIPTRG